LNPDRERRVDRVSYSEVFDYGFLRKVKLFGIGVIGFVVVWVIGTLVQP
jgi:hypothetical protein